MVRGNHAVAVVVVVVEAAVVVVVVVGAEKAWTTFPPDNKEETTIRWTISICSSTNDDNGSRDGVIVRVVVRGRLGFHRDDMGLVGFWFCWMEEIHNPRPSQ